MKLSIYSRRLLTSGSDSFSFGSNVKLTVDEVRLTFVRSFMAMREPESPGLAALADGASLDPTGLGGATATKKI